MEETSNFPYNHIPEKLLLIESNLASKLSECKFSHPVDYIYNPLQYAFEVHAMFVRKYCQSKKKLLFLGMNPGPWGMSQTGVPFGEISLVKEWLGIEGTVNSPDKVCPKRPILGFNCKRREISGWKFWRFFREHNENPFRFFHEAFVYNYCPLAFMTETGKNITPPEIQLSERKLLKSLCDKAFCEVVKLLQVDTVIGVGKFAEKCAVTALRTIEPHGVKVVSIPHPSPRNFSISNWQMETEKCLKEMNLMHFFI